MVCLIEALKDDLLKAVHNVEWIPTWGETA